MQRLYKILLVYFVAFGICQSMNAFTCPSHLSSDWYPQNHMALQEKIQKIDAAAARMYPGNTGKIRAIVAPHASLDYSGKLAAACWRRVKNQLIKRVIILVPSQEVPFCGVLLPTCSEFAFPHGTLTVDKDCINKLSAQPTYFVTSPYVDTKCEAKKAMLRPKNNGSQTSDFVRNPFLYGHALEMQLLFCLHYCPVAQIVPLIVGTLGKEDAEKVAMYLKDCVDMHTLVVASSDFIHYGPIYDYQPFPKDVDFYAHLKNLTMSLVEPIKNASLDNFVQQIKDTQATLSGKNPLMVLIALSNKKAWGVSHLIGYETSDPLNVKTDCVSYVGLVWDDSKK